MVTRFSKMTYRYEGVRATGLMLGGGAGGGGGLVLARVGFTLSHVVLRLSETNLGAVGGNTSGCFLAMIYYSFFALLHNQF